MDALGSLTQTDIDSVIVDTMDSCILAAIDIWIYSVVHSLGMAVSAIANISFTESVCVNNVSGWIPTLLDLYMMDSQSS